MQVEAHAGRSSGQAHTEVGKVRVAKDEHNEGVGGNNNACRHSKDAHVVDVQQVAQALPQRNTQCVAQTYASILV